MPTPLLRTLENSDEFIQRHIGPNANDITDMLKLLNIESIETLIEQTIPQNIRSESTTSLDEAINEFSALEKLRQIAEKNKLYKNYIGLGYHPTIVPPVIQRNVLENPGWYTAYTPYQPEIAQGRLEGLLNFQQLIVDLTGMEMANASMLDEATAAAEAMAMAKRVARKNHSNTFVIDKNCHPQTLAVINTRAEHFGFEVRCEDLTCLDTQDYFAVLAQYPGSDGKLTDLTNIAEHAHSNNAMLIVAADIMSLVLLTPPAAYGADIVVGSNQRFGVPMGFGGPHAAFFAFREKHKRSTPGRIIGVSKDRRGKHALRMAMQTREQHIRREKANSNICTSQVLLALMSAFYAMYHGPDGIKKIAQRIHLLTKALASGLTTQGLKLKHQHFFDTLCIDVGENQSVLLNRAKQAGLNFRKIDSQYIGISINETTTLNCIQEILAVFSGDTHAQHISVLLEKAEVLESIPQKFLRADVLVHNIFRQYHSETELLRYLKRLESRDIALNHAMIPLGSCTMKLNATAEMIPVTWPEFSQIHPFAPIDQVSGYMQLFDELESMLKACTGYDAISLQPNAGSQGEYAGLVAIKKYFEHQQDYNRRVCLIPASAHGTNPASAQMAGMDVIVVACDAQGNVDIADLKTKIEAYGSTIAALMVTYPSTHGVFEQEIATICKLIHDVGGQVYIDGANMNALVGLAAPGEFGGDVSHLNLHKTFCIPHGGGGPGMGPIGVKAHLAPFLASHPLHEIAGTKHDNGTISAAPWGSASILPISWMYISMMGNRGMKLATEIAILNANYIATRLKHYYPILYTGENGFVAHECLLDLRPIKEKVGVSEEDIAKRLMDFGFHAPTMSFPVAGTLMIEPTESEAKVELDRFCDAMIQIHQEIEKIENGHWSINDNPLVNAPHTLDDILDENWTHDYTREEASRALPYLKEHKVWPTVNRIDNVYGDRNLICTCPSVEEYKIP